MKKYIKIKNNRASLYVNILLCTLSAYLLIGLLFLTINFKIPTKNPLFYIIPLITILAIILFKGTFSFSYDSEGGVLCFKNTELLGIYKEKRAEFPIEKLIEYKIKGYIRKELVLVLCSKNSKCKTVKIRYNISYLTIQELELLKESLNNSLNKTNLLAA